MCIHMVKNRCGVKETKETTKHIPVLLEEVLEGLALASGKSVVDATLGGGGHTRAILAGIAPTGKLLSLDQDSEALERFQKGVEKNTDEDKALSSGRLILAEANFSDIKKIIDEKGFEEVDAILADLGYSSDQIEESSRGFSFLQDGPLDMRLSQKTDLTAAQFVRDASVEEMTRVFRVYGEEDRAYQYATLIVKERTKNPFETTRELALFIEKHSGGAKSQKNHRIHPATKIFQALRIHINKEYEHLENFLSASLDTLSVGGRIAIISFHSGEDRRVKEFFLEQARGCICPKEFPVCICGRVPTLRIITRKVIVPREEEQSRNPRSRSAKLRIAEKI